MKSMHRVAAIAVVILSFTSFTAASLLSEQPSIGLSPIRTPYNLLESYVYNDSNYNYRVGYLNFSGYGNSVAYVYAVLPLQGLKVVSQNYTGPLLYFSIYKVSQRTGFPFSNTSLSASIQISPSKYLTSPKSNLVPLAQPFSLSSLVQGSFANKGVGVGNLTIWANITFTPSYNVGPYHISGKAQTLSFRFVVNVSNTTKT